MKDAVAYDLERKELSENSVGVRAIDDYTLEIRFKSPTNIDTWFVSYGGEYRVLPKHLLEGYSMSEITTYFGSFRINAPQSRAVFSPGIRLPT